MQKEELEYFRGILQKQLDDLIKGAGKTVNGMTNPEEAAMFPDPNDRASVESDRNLELRIRDRERKLISKIKKTIEKIDNGDFGYCDTCGEPIGFKRLEARPVTDQCIECKESAEEEEKIRRM